MLGKFIRNCHVWNDPNVALQIWPCSCPTDFFLVDAVVLISLRGQNGKERSCVAAAHSVRLSRTGLGVDPSLRGARGPGSLLRAENWQSAVGPQPGGSASFPLGRLAHGSP